MEIGVGAAVGVPGSVGIFFVGTDVVMTSVGQGTVCIGNGTRMPIATTVGDALDFEVDFDAPWAQSMLTPGASLLFQAWFRDNVNGTPTFNFSEAHRVNFL